MKLYNTINNSHNNRTTTNGANTKIRTLNGTRYVSQFNDNNKEVKVGCNLKSRTLFCFLTHLHNLHTLNLVGQTIDKCL